jgi:hypothetical protein
MLTEKLRKLTPYLMAGAIALGGYACKSGSESNVPAGVKGNVENVVQKAAQSARKTVCWEKTFGGDGGDSLSSVIQTSDGGYLAAGYTISKSVRRENGWVLKLNNEGALEWEKTFDSNSADRLSSLVEDPQGGYVIAGYTKRTKRDIDAWLMKLDAKGNVKWDKKFGGDLSQVISLVHRASDGGYIAAGFTDLKNGRNAWVLKISSEGSKEWEKTFPNLSYHSADSIRQTSDGGYIIAGYTQGKRSRDDGQITILKLNSRGDRRWIETFGGLNPDSPNSIIQTSEGGYLLIGETSVKSDEMKGARTSNALIVKIDQYSNLEWQRSFGKSHEFGSSSSLQATLDGKYIAAGFAWFKGENAWLLKFDSQGNIAWDKIFEGKREGSYNLSSVYPTSDGGYIAAGSFTPKDSAIPDGWILKLDTEGNLNCQ